MPLYAVRMVFLFERRPDGLGMTYLEEQLGYEADEAEGVPDGHEIWSALFQSRETLEEFHASRYERYRSVPPES